MALVSADVEQINDVLDFTFTDILGAGEGMFPVRSAVLVDISNLR
jgi:hypothetical protein